MAKAVKTNALRILETAKVPFEVRSYEVDEEHLDGVTAAAKLGLAPEMVYKTLVLSDAQNGHLVCVIPVERELDLKAVARAAGQKSVSMLPMKELLPLTGYVRGGCSPIGMKKAFPTFIQKEAEGLERMAVSAGARGLQVILSPGDLKRSAKAVYAELCR